MSPPFTSFRSYFEAVKFKILFIAAVNLFLSLAQSEPDLPKSGGPAKLQSLIYTFPKTKLKFNSRYYFMNTNNDDGYGTDFYGNGLNTELNYSTFIFNRKVRKDSLMKNRSLLFEVSYSHIFNLNSSTLVSGNRYEIGLFDILNPAAKNFGQITDLRLDYQSNSFNLKVGRMIPRSPFINSQDGRLRPTYFQGINAVYSKNMLSKGFNFIVDLSLANEILVRSTNQWKSINESIGIYPSGVSINGKPATYINQNANFGKVVFFPSFVIYQVEKKKSDSSGIIKKRIDHKAVVRDFVVYMDQLFITNMLEYGADITLMRKNKLMNSKSSFKYSMMWIHQKSLTKETDQISENNYIEQNAKSNIFSGQLMYRLKLKTLDHLFDFSATRITNDGRYLMPREWGRDPFYTFLPRERNEGFGDVTAFTIKYSLVKKIPENFLRLSDLRFDVGYGNYKLPDVKNYALNKYGMPSYQQLNVSFNFAFNYIFRKHFWDRDNLQFIVLYAQKFNRGNTYDQSKYVFNKVDMSQLNVIINYNLLLFKR